MLWAHNEACIKLKILSDTPKGGPGCGDELESLVTGMQDSELSIFA